MHVMRRAISSPVKVGFCPVFDLSNTVADFEPTIGPCKCQTLAVKSNRMPETTVDVDALYAALDRKRQEAKLSWRALAGKLEITPSTFTRMAQGLKPDVDTFATLIRWLGRSQEEFLLPARRTTKDADPMAMI